MSPAAHIKQAQRKPNGNRTVFLRKAARRIPRLYYYLAKSQLEIRKLTNLIRKDEFEDIANELEDLLLQKWDKRTSQAITHILRLLHGPGTFNRQLLTQAINELQVTLGTKFGQDIARPLQKIQLSSYITGQKQILEVKPTFNLVDKQAIAWLQENQVFWVRNYFDRQLKDTVAQAGQQAIEQGLDRRQAAQLFEDAFGDTINPQGIRYWQGFANHVTTRAREFGRVEAYVKAGVTEIEIDAVLDHRTSTICRHMNGRIIKVRDAVELRDKMMSAQNPEQIKEIAPFMRPDDVLGVSTANLKSKSAGFALPPYHYDCRTRTVKRRTVYEQNRVHEIEDGSELEREEFAEDKKLLSDLTKQEYSNNLQMMRTKSQLRFNRADLKDDWPVHGPDFPDIDSIKEYRLRATKNVKQATRITAHIYNGEKQYRFYGPDGITVVDGGAEVRGFYYHKDVEKAFNGIRKKSIWLKTNENS